MHTLNFALEKPTKHKQAIKKVCLDMGSHRYSKRPQAHPICTISGCPWMICLSFIVALEISCGSELDTSSASKCIVVVVTSRLVSLRKDRFPTMKHHSCERLISANDSSKSCFTCIHCYDPALTFVCVVSWSVFGIVPFF